MKTRFDPCAYEEKMLKDLAGMQRVRLQEYSGQWWEVSRTHLLARLNEAALGLAETEDLRDIEVKCADIANFVAMISADARWVL